MSKDSKDSKDSSDQEDSKEQANTKDSKETKMDIAQNRKARLREELGQKFIRHAVDLICNPRRPGFHGGAYFTIDATVKGVKGPRVCAAKLNAGFDNDRLLKMLTKPRLPHLIPWECKLPPIAYPDGKYIVIEAPWPDGLERSDIRLSDVRGPDSMSGDTLVLGVNQYGTTITLPATEIEHVLASGQTGSGKSTTLQVIIAQLSLPRRKTTIDGRSIQAPSNRIVMIDCKRGHGFGPCDGLPGQVGPLAVSARDAVNALGWCVREMNARYDMMRSNNINARDFLRSCQHVFVCIDEFQVLAAESRVPAFASLLGTLLTEGRGAGFHVVGATHKPTVGMFGKGNLGSASSDQLSVIIGQRVKTFRASQVVMGAPWPRCDFLQDKGDAYISAKTPDTFVERVQIPRIEEDDLRAMSCGKTDLSEWPEFDASSIAWNGGKRGRSPKPVSDMELAVGIETVVLGRGRDNFMEQLDDGEKPGTNRYRKSIMPKCEKIVGILTSRGRISLSEV